MAVKKASSREDLLHFIDESRRKLWTLNLRRANFFPTRSTKICSKHFTADCFETAKFGGTWLKQNAVPTLFDLPPEQQKIPMITLPPIKRKPVISVKDDASIRRRCSYLGDFKEEDMECPEKAKKALSAAKEVYTKQKAQIRRLQLKLRRLQDKTIRLQKKSESKKRKRSTLEKASLVSKMSSNWRNGIKGVLLDITGVLYESGQGAIPGSVDAVNRLRDNKIPFRFVTNETQRTCASLVTKLRDFGFTLSESDVISPGVAVAAYLKQKMLRPLLLVHPELLPEFSDCDQSSPNCVVIGDAADYFTYENMNQCFQLLLASENPVLISMGRGKYYKENGQIVMDLGGYTCALEFAAGVEATVIGKPSSDYFMNAVESLGLLPCETVMVGDDINSDVGAAKNCDLKGVLVRTGKFREVDLQNSSVKPDAVVDNLAHFVEILLNEKEP
ncbi:hypothetical protein JTE90_010234 [Oedothorax gibbosus]|uniref:Phospholysine phosphohistidine inorganic pyrophosphate phosphatase n=1 Tax=Oedothorax gibbosus TaxID=931172 RepID=A0AAV6U0E0_9ARAC|nr:hypothetical protein JTE90_010234 [Oedothorax gibbosus]